MYKVMYWSIKKGKLVIIMFSLFDDLMEYIYKNEDDVELDDHFIKIVKEVIKK